MLNSSSDFTRPILYRMYIPRPPLAAFINSLWLYEGINRPHARERRLPSGSLELVINLREDLIRVYDRHNHDQFQSFPGSLICGAHSEFFVIDADSQESVMGVHFKPGGAFPFFQLPVGELHNLHLSLDTLWGTSANDLRWQLLEARTPDEKFRILEQSLLAHAAPSFILHPAFAYALAEFQHLPSSRAMANVTAQTGLSPKRFISVFNREVGLTPKLYCRVRRFQAALEAIGQGQQVDWADIALVCGYFDQAHFNHDFQAFSGLNPSTYLAQRREYLNHVPLGD